MNPKLLLALILLPLNVLASDLKYELFGYGTKHLVVIISGEGAADLSSNLSSDGLSLRISGIDVGFEAKDQGKPLPGAVSQLNQVKRDAYTDFLLSFSSPFELNVAPGSNELKLVLKSKTAAGAGVVAAAQTAAQGAAQSGAPLVPTSSAAAQSSSETQAALLEQLTSELVRLRAELEGKEKEIAKLKEGCNAN